ncbi:MAG: hypothetical protein JOS17DRAFT_805567 [Linnemannia elongata]|nr:MAG: hypothetical protein JOS17DRAFT_805567 [Linnemannia elongata]
MVQPIDRTTPTATPHSPTHTAARIVVPTETPIPLTYRVHTHPGDPIPSPALSAVPVQSPPDLWTYYYPPPVTSTSPPLSSSEESGSSKSIVGPAVGGAVGGLFLVCLVVLIVVHKRKKSKEARKRRLDFLEGRNPVGLFAFGGVDFMSSVDFKGGDDDDGTAAITVTGGGGNGGSGAVAATGHRQLPLEASSYPTHHQEQQQQNQHESEEQDEQQYDPYFAHLQRQMRLQMQAARDYYAAQHLQQKQIQGYYSEGLLYQHPQSQHFTPATSTSIRLSYDGSLSPTLTPISAPSSYPAYAYPYPRRPPPPVTMGVRRHSSPWMTSPSQYQYQYQSQQSIGEITAIGRRATLLEKRARSATVGSSPTRDLHIIAENHVEIPLDI